MSIAITEETMNLAALYIPGAIALILGLLLPMLIRPLLVRWNMVDIPTARSSHTQPTFRGMGLATALAATVAYVAALVFGLIPSDRVVACSVLLGMVLSGALGWMEDLKGVSIVKRFGAQIFIGLLVTVMITASLGTSIVWVPLGVFAVAAYINVVNFMDGINGISGFHGAIVGAFYTYAGVVNQLPWLAIGGVSLACAYLAFLPWNIRPGKHVFLGDAGSYFLGGSIAAMAVGAFLSGIYVEYVLAPVLVYLADTGFTLLRRMLTGQQWYKPHRTHVYQRLTDVGISHMGSTCIVSLTTIAVSIISIAALPFATQQTLWAGVAVVAILGLYLALPALIARIFRSETNTNTHQ